MLLKKYNNINLFDNLESKYLINQKYNQTIPNFVNLKIINTIDINFILIMLF